MGFWRHDQQPEYTLAKPPSCSTKRDHLKHPKTGKPLTDDDGNSLFTFNASAANRALELIGKHVGVGAFKDRLEVEHHMILVQKIQAGRERLAKPKTVQPALG